MESASRTPLGITADDKLTLNMYYTYLISLEKRSLPGAPLEENLGQLDGEGRLGAGFKHKASANINYKTGPFKLNWQVNYLGKIQDTLGGYSTPDEPAPELDALNSVGAKIYNDIQFGWTVEDGRSLEFYMGVDNVFNVKAPFLPSGFASNITGTETAADTYDPFGRRFYAGVNIKF